MGTQCTISGELFGRAQIFQWTNDFFHQGLVIQIRRSLNGALVCERGFRLEFEFGGKGPQEGEGAIHLCRLRWFQILVGHRLFNQ